MKVETDGEQHVFEVQVYLNDLDPKAVRVELYADGVKGGDSSAAGDEARAPPAGGASGGYVYQRGGVCGPPASGLHGASDTASRRRCGSAGSRSNPVAAMIQTSTRMKKRLSKVSGRMILISMTKGHP